MIAFTFLIFLEVSVHPLSYDEDKIATVNNRIKPRLKEISLCVWLVKRCSIQVKPSKVQSLNLVT